MKDGDDMRSLRGTWAFRVTARGKSADRVSFSEGENVVHLPEPQLGIGTWIGGRAYAGSHGEMLKEGR